MSVLPMLAAASIAACSGASGEPLPSAPSPPGTSVDPNQPAGDASASTTDAGAGGEGAVLDASASVVPSSDASVQPDAGCAASCPATPGKVLLYGGYSGNPASAALSDTWEWNGSTWTQKAVSGPGGRYAHALAAVGSGVALFGGTSAPSDTWFWSGSGWAALGATGPASRDRATASSLGGRMILFGGRSPEATPFGDTWELAGTTWAQRNAFSHPRHGSVAATLGAKVVQFGGRQQVGAFASALSSETWEWDGNNWTQRTALGPPARESAAMAELDGKLVLFGGFDDLKALGDTWTWDGTTWTKSASQGPPARFGHAMARLGQKVVLYGGQTQGAQGLAGDTWEWDGTSWTQRSVTSPPARSHHAMVAY